MTKLSDLAACFYKKTEALDAALLDGKHCSSDPLACAQYYRDTVFAAMQELRAVADELETLVGDRYWPFPTYTTLLFSV